EIRTFDLVGKALPKPKQLTVATVGDLTPLDGDDLLFSNESFVEPFGKYLFLAKTGETVKTGLTTDPPVQMKDVTVRREFASSKDGTSVPINVLVPKSAKTDGSAPCLVTGYGGYGINIEPHFSPVRRILFDHGFIVAVVNLRGGGEFGEEW